MREVPAKPLPGTLPAAHAVIRRLKRDLMSSLRTNTYLEDRLVELTSQRLTILGVRPVKISAHPLRYNSGER